VPTILRRQSTMNGIFWAAISVAGMQGKNVSKFFAGRGTNAAVNS
jgi:hypothetical protein